MTLPIYRQVILPLLSACTASDAEKAHEIGLWLVKALGIRPFGPLLKECLQVSNPAEVAGVVFPNRIGLAAGIDKTAAAILGFQAFGFGFVEVGTVVPKLQKGNPLPRMFRLVDDKAMINRLGFNSPGVEVVAQNLKQIEARITIPVGINIGKNKDTPDKEAVGDYVACIGPLIKFADYIAINVSSPNTPGLRDLQHGKILADLICAVKEEILAQCISQSIIRIPPVLVKVAPDLDLSQKKSILSVIKEKADGVIINNTTVDRPDSLKSIHRGEQGGLSGVPLFKRTLEFVTWVHKEFPNLPIIGVGGISSPRDACEMIEAGASLVQILTGLVFEGPLFPSRIAHAIKSHIV